MAETSGDSRRNGEKYTSSELKLSVSTWNILADSYARRSSYPYCPLDTLYWTSRSRDIKFQLRAHLTDIIALQECDHYTDTFAPFFTAIHYEHTFTPRPQRNDGCCIAWNQDKFTAIKQPRIVYYDELAKHSTYHDEVRYAKANIALLIWLQPNNTELSPILLVNTHLYWHPLYEDVKLHQIAYLMQTIQHELTKYNTDNNNIIGDNNTSSALPAPLVILLGDFNSSPDSRVYEYITRGTIQRQLSNNNAPDSIRLIVDSTLYKIAKWLRSVGVDCEFNAASSTTEGALAMFAKARAENRIIISRSRQLVQRRTCPKYLLIPPNCSTEDIFATVIFHFGITYNKDRVFSRCTLCNSMFAAITLEELKDDPPAELPASLLVGLDEGGNPIQFFRCLNPDCRHVYWWGSKSLGAADKFKSVFERLATQRESDQSESENGTEEGKTDDNDVEQKAAHESADSTQLDRTLPGITLDRDELLLLPAPFTLQSVFIAKGPTTLNPPSQDATNADEQTPDEATLTASEPAFTNYHEHFHDTLDYIFVGSALSSSTRLVVSSALCLPTTDSAVASRHVGFPSVEWPSDHCLISATMTMSQ